MKRLVIVPSNDQFRLAVSKRPAIFGTTLIPVEKKFYDLDLETALGGSRDSNRYESARWKIKAKHQAICITSGDFGSSKFQRVRQVLYRRPCLHPTR